MAYKFQVGDSVMSGSLTVSGDVFADRDGTGGGLVDSKTGDVIVNEKVMCFGSVLCSGTLKLSHATQGKITAATGSMNLISLAPNGGDNTRCDVSLGGFEDAGSDVELDARVYIGHGGGGTNGTIVLKDDSTNNNIMVGAGGTYDMVSGSGNLTLNNGSATSTMVDCTVNGALQVDGNITAAATAELEIDSLVFWINNGGANDTQNDSTSILFGDSTNAAFGAALMFRTGSVAMGAVDHLSFVKGAVADTNAIPIRANKFVGDGANVGLSKAITGYPKVESKVNGNTCVVGVNLCSANNAVINLPALSGVGVGATVIVKSTMNSSTDSFSVASNGSEKIDGGTANILIQSPWASLSFIKLSDSLGWMIM